DGTHVAKRVIRRHRPPGRAFSNGLQPSEQHCIDVGWDSVPVPTVEGVATRVVGHRSGSEALTWSPGGSSIGAAQTALGFAITMRMRSGIAKSRGPRAGMSNSGGAARFKIARAHADSDRPGRVKRRRANETPGNQHVAIWPQRAIVGLFTRSVIDRDSRTNR